MKFIIKKDKTSKFIDIFISNSTSTAGAGLSGLVYNSAGLKCYYIREGDASPTEISLVNATVGIWISGGFKEIQATNMKGRYQLGLPNAVLATGADFVSIELYGVSNMAQLPIEIQLVDNIVKDVYDIAAHTDYGNAKLVRATIPANKLDIDGSGEVTAENMRGTDNAALASTLSTHDGKLDTVDTVVDAIKTVTDNLPNSGSLTDINSGISRILGLSYENTYQHTRTYSSGKLTSAKLDLYDSKANAQTHDGSTGIEAKYTLTFTYSGDELTAMQVVRDG
jgi:hypothetical protein